MFRSPDRHRNLMLPPQIGEGGLSREEIYALFPNLIERARSSGGNLSGGVEQQMLASRILRTGAKL